MRGQMLDAASSGEEENEAWQNEPVETCAGADGSASGGEGERASADGGSRRDEGCFRDAESNLLVALVVRALEKDTIATSRRSAPRADPRRLA